MGSYLKHMSQYTGDYQKYLAMHTGDYQNTSLCTLVATRSTCRNGCPSCTTETWLVLRVGWPVAPWPVFRPLLPVLAAMLIDVCAQT
jgi:hypothetical protein